MRDILMRRDFFSPRLVGRRFEDHTIPLDILRDLSALGDFLLDVAKSKYLDDHPERVRTPKGFFDGVSIRLSGVDEGSAIPRMELFVPDDADLFQLPAEEYLNKARQSIVSAVAAAEAGEDASKFLSPKLLCYFNKFGRGLQGDEYFELSSNDGDFRAHLNKAVRHKLILASESDGYTEEVCLRGAVPEVDQQKMTFELQLATGVRVPVAMEMQHLQTVLEASNEYKSRFSKVSVSGVAKYGRNNRLESVIEIEQVGLLESNDPLVRLDELRVLKSGWLDGQGSVPSKSQFDYLEAFFDALSRRGVPNPYIYPTSDGGVQAEWGDVMTAEFVMAKNQLEIYAGDDEVLVDLNELDAAVEVLSSKVRELLGG